MRWLARAAEPGPPQEAPTGLDPAVCAPNGAYQDMPADADGIYRSTIFPGLWLHADALLRLDGVQVMQTLQQGLATPEHAAFVQQLQARRATS